MTRNILVTETRATKFKKSKTEIKTWCIDNKTNFLTTTKGDGRSLEEVKGLNIPPQDGRIVFYIYRGMKRQHVEDFLRWKY